MNRYDMMYDVCVLVQDDDARFKSKTFMKDLLLRLRKKGKLTAMRPEDVLDQSEDDDVVEKKKATSKTAKGGSGNWVYVVARR